MTKQEKCKYCKWSKCVGVWVSECTNENSEHCGDECIEQQGAESEWCDEKETQ